MRKSRINITAHTRVSDISKRVDYNKETITASPESCGQWLRTSHRYHTIFLCVLPKKTHTTVFSNYD